ncbi:MAG: hypothetical protein EHM28_11465 [Spirochaetaceae bacterium]|nr:MAG: hypothetical protein EHM28_11465 [Spirochaetaceae bacterium]
MLIYYNSINRGIGVRILDKIKAVLLVLLLCPTLFGEESAVSQTLWEYLLRQSKGWFESYTNRYGIASMPEWQGPLESAFKKLLATGMETSLAHRWVIVKDTSYNASSFPGGEIVINSGMLKELDRIIARKHNISTGTSSSAQLQMFRENMIAPILAHELGHYYNRHTLEFFKTRWNIAPIKDITSELKLLTFSREQEYEADYTAILLLKQAQYDPGLLKTSIEFLDEISSGETSSAPAAAINVYFDSHPTPKSRLLRLDEKSSAYIREAAILEQAFSDIQIGINLLHACQAMENAIALHPDNIHLLAEKAIALHKLWLSTTSLSEQKLRGILEAPLFHENMIYSDRVPREGMKMLPGDPVLWERARSCYESALPRIQNKSMLSNFALLLSYSPKKEYETKAQDLARMSIAGNMSVAMLNNIAVVFYMTGEKDEAKSLFHDISLQYDSTWTRMIQENATDPFLSKTLRQMNRDFMLNQEYNKQYVLIDFTPLLNLALANHYDKNNQEATRIAYDYLTRYEAVSAWAQTLCDLTSVKIPEPEREASFVFMLPGTSAQEPEGITAGDNIEVLLKNWGKPDSVTEAGDDTHSEYWYYTSLGARVVIEGGEILRISVTQGSRLLINRLFGPGAIREQVEKHTGPCKRYTDSFAIYEGKQHLAILYVLGKSTEISVFTLPDIRQQLLHGPQQAK